MPVFVLVGYDGPRGLELRKQHRPAHVAGLEVLDREKRVRHGGPILGDDGAPIGSVVVFDAASLDEARAIAARDPYVTGGVFERYEVRETSPVFPRGSAARVIETSIDL